MNTKKWMILSSKLSCILQTLSHLAKLPKWWSSVVNPYLYGAFDCMFSSCHVHVSEWIHTLSGCGFESRFSHLNFRYGVCFEQGVPWHSGKYRVWIHAETRTWHDENIQSCIIHLNFAKGNESWHFIANCTPKGGSNTVIQLSSWYTCTLRWHDWHLMLLK